MTRACLRTAVLFGALALAIAGTGALDGRAETGSTDRTWTFDSDATGEPPAGFSFARTGEGKPGRWIVEAETDAPSGPSVLGQTDADATDFRFPVAVADGPAMKDVDLTVKCKMVSGDVDEACGLVWRYQDADNYYVTRANALEDNVRFYTVKDGKRQQLANWKGKVAAGVWHTFRVVARGDHVEIWWDGQKVIEADDKTFAEPGRVGVWTKADSVTVFDDLAVTGL